MKNEIEKKNLSLNELMKSENVQKQLQQILGKNASTFATSVMQVVKSNDSLKNAEPKSILGACMVSATLNLPINNAIGHAYIVPFNEKQKDGSYIMKAQFMLGYKGLIQLAMRSGQFKTINVTEVKEGEVIENDRLTGEIKFNWLEDRDSLKTIGYVGYFSLINGFEKSMYMSVKQLNEHGEKYSKTYKQAWGNWKKEFDAMATKTVLKLLLGKYAPLSVEMQKAQLTDQAIISDLEGNEVSYADNTIDINHEEISDLKEEKRITEYIASCEDLVSLEVVKSNLNETTLPIYEAKEIELSK